MTKHILSFMIATGLFCQTACLQNSDNTKSCYSDKLPDKDKVFTNMLNKPHFKGGHDSLVSFLLTNIHVEEFISDLSQNERTYHDTVRTKFVVNKQGGLSNLSVKMTKKTKFTDEITRVIKESSCNWVAGGTERLLNVWHQVDIYFSIDKSFDKEVKTSMTINEL